MFLVVNKEKMTSYIVSIATVAVLFVMASSVSLNKNTVETGANIQNELIINNIQENENNTSNQNNTLDKNKKNE